MYVCFIFSWLMTDQSMTMEICNFWPSRSIGPRDWSGYKLANIKWSIWMIVSLIKTLGIITFHYMLYFLNIFSAYRTHLDERFEPYSFFIISFADYIETHNHLHLSLALGQLEVLYRFVVLLDSTEGAQFSSTWPPVPSRCLIEYV